MRQSTTVAIAPVMFMLLFSLRSLAQDPDPRNPAPGGAALSEAESLLRDVFGDEFKKAKTSAEKTALAEKMIRLAAQPDNDLPSRYVLLRVARDIAALSGDAKTALAAVEETAQTFAVDGLSMKTDVLQKCADSARLAQQYAQLVPVALRVMDEAVTAERYDMAVQLGELARDSASKTRDYALRRQVIDRLTAVQGQAQQYEKVRQAVAALEENPRDADANLAVGKYRCFFRGDWETGLPMLALGSDPTLSGLAKQELAAPESADGQAELADAWWKYTENAEGPAKEATQIRAGRWYHQALPGLAGLSEVKAERRLQELAKLGVSDWKPIVRQPVVRQPVVRQPIVQQTSPRKYEPVNLLALIDPAQDHYSDLKWSFVGGALVAMQEGRHPRIKVPYIPPDEYDLELEVTRPKNR